MFPDACGWISKFAKSNATVAKLRSVLGYDGPIEMLSMYLCVLCSVSMHKFLPERLQAVSSELQRRAHASRSKHPLTLVAECY